jgi:hypothetical protein
LPDKYLFLLFADKREVELVWNGKTNEVCNIVLPFQVIEQVDEPRAESETGRKDPQGMLFDLADSSRFTHRTCVISGIPVSEPERMDWMIQAGLVA